MGDFLDNNENNVNNENNIENVNNITNESDGSAEKGDSIKSVEIPTSGEYIEPNVSDQNPFSYNDNPNTNQGGPIPPYGYQNPVNDKSESIAFGVTSLVLGIITLVLFCSCTSIITGIVGIVFGIIQIVSKKKKGLAIAGVITSFIGVIAFGVFWIIIFTSSSFTDSFQREFQREFEKQLQEELENMEYLPVDETGVEWL